MNGAVSVGECQVERSEMWYASDFEIFIDCKFNGTHMKSTASEKEKEAKDWTSASCAIFAAEGILFNVLKVVCTPQRPIWDTELIREFRVLTDLTSVPRRCTHSSLKSGQYIKAFRCTCSPVKRIRARKLCGFLTATIHFSSSHPHTPFPCTRTFLNYCYFARFCIVYLQIYTFNHFFTLFLRN